MLCGLKGFDDDCFHRTSSCESSLKTKQINGSLYVARRIKMDIGGMTQN